MRSSPPPAPETETAVPAEPGRPEKARCRTSAAEALLSPLGAVVVIGCFFLPWVEVSCTGMNRTFSGAQIGGLFWFIPLAAAVSLLALVQWHRRGRRNRADLLIAAFALLALAVVAVQYVRFANRGTSMAEAFAPGGISFRLCAGGVGTLVGLALSLIGALLLGRHNRSG